MVFCLFLRCRWLNCALSGMVWKISLLWTSLLDIKTNDVTSGRKGADPHGWLRVDQGWICLEKRCTASSKSETHCWMDDSIFYRLFICYILFKYHDQYLFGGEKCWLLCEVGNETFIFLDSILVTSLFPFLSLCMHATSFYTKLKISHINIAKFPNDCITVYDP